MPSFMWDGAMALLFLEDLPQLQRFAQTSQQHERHKPFRYMYKVGSFVGEIVDTFEMSKIRLIGTDVQQVLGA